MKILSKAVRNNKDVDPVHELQLLRFAVQDIQFSIFLENVDRVLPLVALQSVPGSPNYLVGLLNIHGTSIPVVDLTIRLGNQRVQPYTIDDSIILCRHAGEVVGIVVSEVYGFESVSEHTLQMKAQGDGDAPLPYLAVVNTSRGSSLLLDVSCIMDIQLSDQFYMPHASVEYLDEAKVPDSKTTLQSTTSLSK